MTPYEKERAVEQLTQLVKLVIHESEKAKERGERTDISVCLGNIATVFVGEDVFSFYFDEDMKKAIDAMHEYIDRNETERERLTAAIDAKRAELEQLYEEFERKFPKNEDN